MKFRLSASLVSGLWACAVAMSGTGLAQTVAQNQPPSDGGYVPWPAPAGQAPAAPPASGGGEGGSFVPPMSPPSEGFDSFDDEEEEPGGFGGGSRRGGPEGKESFKLIQRPKEPGCGRWSSLLLETTYDDKLSCEFDLEQKIDRGRSSMEELTDKVEREMLKGVIRQEVDKSKMGKYEVKFDALAKTLDEAQRAGCKCN